MEIPTSEAWESPVDDRIQQIVNGLDNNPEFAEESLPGLKELLVRYLSANDQETNTSDFRVEFLRSLIKVFKDSKTDGTYSEELAKYTPEEANLIERFVEGEDPEELGEGFLMGPSVPVREELQMMEAQNDLEADGASNVMLFHKLTAAQATDPMKVALNQMRKERIGVYENVKFQNWGLNIENKPRYTFVPSEVSHVQSIVSFAKQFNLSVRCSGYRHSWSPSFGQNGQVLISMLDIHSVNKLPNRLSLPGKQAPATKLESIEKIKGTTKEKGNTLVRIGCATTNERLRRWCINEGMVTLPLNVIMVEITIGGSNAPICHGAGRKNQTLSDLVRKIEYVDANGKLQSVNDPAHLRAASGCFGLMGVVTHITMEFAPMTYALFEPIKIPVTHAVPPPPGMNLDGIPPALLREWTPLSQADKQKCQEEFERRANSDYYAEWFWFPYADYSWVNTWNNTAEPKGVQPYPSDKQIWLTYAQTVGMNLFQNASVLQKLIKLVGLTETIVTLISKAAMVALPFPDKPVKTFLPDALHFQRAIQNVRVRDVEVEIPLCQKQNAQKGVVDYTPIQQAWWDAILLTYKYSRSCPMSMPLEMRIMGGSNVIMAPQRGNDLGTCSIEVLTLRNLADNWPVFAQEVLNKWMVLKDPATKKQLAIRPHWAKEWYNFKVDGKPWIERLKNVDYKNQRREFVKTLGEIGKNAGWTLKDMQKRFSNDLFDNLFFDDKSLLEEKHEVSNTAVAMKTRSQTNAAKVDAMQVTVTEISVDDID